jgi:signal transduction histidine kinase
MTAVLTVELRYEHDVVLARQRTRRLAELLGFDAQDCTRLATAVSEIARNAFEYATGGRVEFFHETREGRGELVIRIRDNGPGIADLKAVLDGRYTSRTGLGLGILGAKRLSDRFEITTTRGAGTTVTLAKRLAGGSVSIADVVASLAAVTPETPFAELQSQNQELLRALAEVRQRQAEIERLNQELEETNRGVLALYSELDERAGYLSRINEMKTRFLSELSHELRTPLNAIRNVCRFLLDGYQGELNEGQRKGMVMIGDSATALTAFVDDWLDLAKIEAGRIDVHPSAFSVEELFGTLRGVFRPLAMSPNVELAFVVIGDVLPLYTDEPKVSQILRNLISNALKFTESGEVRVTAQRVDDDVRIDVADTGIGVGEQDRDRIFEAFTQVEHSLQQRTKGTGLGLPLSRKLARLLGGDIWMTPRDGGGSVFSLRIPVDVRASLTVSGETAVVDAVTNV